jgi:hypothetical protein
VKPADCAHAVFQPTLHSFVKAVAGDTIDG